MLVRDLKVGDILYDTHEVVGSGEAPGELKWLVLYDHTWKLLWTTSSKDPYWNQYVIAGRFVEIGTLPVGAKIQWEIGGVIGWVVDQGGVYTLTTLGRGSKDVKVYLADSAPESSP